ncbi:cytochrome P450 2G1-like [Ambystoma mexicanum]|uniref:cytochrome P450 2G1-like n=1 Tax=Ambystoma mexicanum TaxID=8296 RepID=UPI0037E7798A
MEVGSTTCLLLITFIFTLLLMNVRKVFQKGKLPPGPTPLPLVGNILQVKNGKIVKSILKLRDIYGPVFTMYLGPRRVVALCGYEAIKEALIDHGDDFITRGSLPSFEMIFHGYGIGVLNGEQWKEIRRFSVMTLRNFGMGKRSIEERIQEEAQYLMKELRKTKGSPFEPTSALIHAAANIIFSITVGKRFDYEDTTFNKILLNIREGFNIMSSFWGQLYEMFPKFMIYIPGPHRRMFKLFKYLEDFIQARVDINLETLDANSPRDFIDCYFIRKEQGKLNTSTKSDRMNLVMTVMDIIFGGTETITSTMKYGLLILMKYPDVQEKVQEEIDNVVGERSTPAFEDRLKMPYTNAVVHEIQRFSDIVPLGAAHSVTRDIPFREFVITKGTDIFPMLTTAHKDPTYFRDPNNFNPEHFLDDKGNFMKNDAFMPFSIGKRNCPGISLAQTELFLLLTSILKNFHLKSLTDLNELDLTPIESGFENLPPPYELCFIPR